MIGLVAGLPLSFPTPPRTAPEGDSLDDLRRTLQLSDDQVVTIRRLFERFARRQAMLAVGDVLLENRAVLRHIVTAPAFDRRQAHRLARQVADVVARRMENRLELRNQLFRALTPAQRKTYVETLRGMID
jgi:Spy/CpxP family protein refolding chaperone